MIPASTASTERAARRGSAHARQAIVMRVRLKFSQQTGCPAIFFPLACRGDDPRRGFGGSTKRGEGA